MRFNLYVTDWEPNGTNTLLICDEDHQIVAAVEEATFGIDVMKYRSPFNDLIANESSVFSTTRLKEGDELPSEFTFVRQITLKELKRFLCVSPIDPAGARITAKLKQHGIDLIEAAPELFEACKAMLQLTYPERTEAFNVRWFDEVLTPIVRAAIAKAEGSEK